MKKYPKTLKHRIINKKRSKNRHFRTLIFKSKKKLKPKIRALPPPKKSKYDDYFKIKTPINFSIIENPCDIIEFIDQVELCLEKEVPIFIDINESVMLGYDGILILLALLVKFKEGNVDFAGNFPKVHNLDKKFRESGFFHVLQTKNFDISRLNKFQDENDNIITKAGYEVSSNDKTNIIKIISKNILGYEANSDGLFNTIGEIMTNSNEHGSDGSGIEITPWWVSINKNEINDCYNITFLDFGVGILKSLEKKPKDSLYKRAIEKINSDDKGKLESMFDYKKENTISSTGYSFRGNGIPSIKEMMEKNYYSNLNVITNKVKADISNNEYKSLNCNFSGTLISFEVSKNNKFE